MTHESNDRVILRPNTSDLNAPDPTPTAAQIKTIAKKAKLIVSRVKSAVTRKITTNIKRAAVENLEFPTKALKK